MVANLAELNMTDVARLGRDEVIDWLLAFESYYRFRFTREQLEQYPTPELRSLLVTCVRHRHTPNKQGGPKMVTGGGSTSDRIEDAIERRIIQRTWGRVHRLIVETKDGRVIVQGQAPSYYVKQLALIAVFEVLGSTDHANVELDIEVSSDPPRLSAGQTRDNVRGASAS